MSSCSKHSCNVFSDGRLAALAPSVKILMIRFTAWNHPFDPSKTEPCTTKRTFPTNQLFSLRSGMLMSNSTLGVKEAFEQSLSRTCVDCNFWFAGAVFPILCLHPVLIWWNGSPICILASPSQDVCRKHCRMFNLELLSKTESNSSSTPLQKVRQVTSEFRVFDKSWANLKTRSSTFLRKVFQACVPMCFLCVYFIFNLLTTLMQCDDFVAPTCGFDCKKAFPIAEIDGISILVNSSGCVSCMNSCADAMKVSIAQKSLMWNASPRHLALTETMPSTFERENCTHGNIDQNFVLNHLISFDCGEIF